ncbi:MAG: DUF2207 domain-containing protein [Verrucomicrobiota bacterium]
MTREPKLFSFAFALLLVGAISVSFLGAQEEAVAAHSHAPDRLKGEEPQEFLHSLDIRIDMLRTGKVEIEQDFVIEFVEGGEIQRGPILSYLTAYRGLGNLVLHNQMRITEVLRDGKPEPFRYEDHGGLTRLVCGSADTFLAPGPHRYTVRYTRNADWTYRDGEAHWSVDITESFKHFPIEKLSFELHLPEGVEFAYSTPALSGSESNGGTGYELIEEPGKFLFKTNAPLRRDSNFFLNAGWESNSFATQSQWYEVMRQHPKLPLTAFIAIVLFGSLIGLIVRIVKNHRPQPSMAG